ncbi:uncharacterized protein H6S33_007921 [Morchella sextelata]|uniref:uncharacterized protein n=1 Tax=Morchella sextelata TaxID=1174677 RepID=UPI001D04FFD6|nr:uncharacterized protein H6S33_007921 [Morchella sextelata]KAH0602917.1 hypothetical protein H6S33_007921 [Morchella sextelata]
MESAAKIPKFDPLLSCPPATVRRLLGLSSREENTMRIAVRQAYMKDMAGSEENYNEPWRELLRTKQQLTANMTAKAAERIQNLI